jgi:hypothetical protein
MLNKIVPYLILLINFNFLNAQIKLYPEVGIAFSQSNMLKPNPNIVAAKNIFGSYTGFGIYKSVGNNKYLHINFSNTVAWLRANHAVVQKTKGKSLHDKIFFPDSRMTATGVNLRNFTLSYSQEFLLFNFGKNKSINLSPIGGISLNKIAKHWIPKNNFTGIIDTNSINTLNLQDSQFLYVGNGNNKVFGDKFIKNYWGMSLQFGFLIQFKKEEKDRMALHFRYNQGLSMLLYSPFKTMFKDQNGEYWESEFASRGTFWSVSLSYPITILNKKGERYRDRHPR